MLTKSDLSQIRKITQEVVQKTVREEVESESQTTRSEIQSEMKLMRMRIEERLYAIENKLKDVDIKTINLEKIMKNLYADMKKIKKDVSTMIERFDREDVRIEKRIQKIEEHLNLMPS